MVVYGGEERRSGLRESTKAFVRRSKDPFWNDVFVGDGLDVGSGNDPFKKEWFPAVKSVRTFDIADGDAQYLARAFRPGSFDFVHSSNCLEHLRCPWEAVLGWMHVLKPGGHMVFTVPDEDLYEQGVFPSRWNVDHKWTFTWHKDCSWTKRSINLDEMLVGMAKFCEVRRVFLADSGYDRAVTGVDQTVRGAEAFWEVVVRKLPVERKPRTFKHSGARGDLIYGLAAIRAMGGGTLYVNRRDEKYFAWPLCDEEFDGMRKFLVDQGCVEKVLDWKGEAVDCDLDVFRTLRLDYNLLSDAQQMCCGVAYEYGAPWIDPDKVAPIREADIVVGRSARYHGTFDWGELVPWVDRCVFVGSEQERQGFREDTGIDLRRADTPSWSELAGVIRGGKLFVGNQSMAYSLAEAMKVPRVLESYLACPNCDPRGKDGHTVLSQDVIRRYVEGKGDASAMVASRNPWASMAFQSAKRSKSPPKFALVIPGCAKREAVERLEAEAKLADVRVVVQGSGSSFEEMANGGAARTDEQIICVVDADAGMRLIDVMAVVGQMLGSRVGMAGACTSTRFGAHVSGPCVAVSRKAYEQMGLFNPAMSPGAVNMLELNLRYAKGKYGCKSAALAQFSGWERLSRKEWDEGNMAYLGRMYGVKP